MTSDQPATPIHTIINAYQQHCIIRIYREKKRVFNCVENLDLVIINFLHRRVIVH